MAKSKASTSGVIELERLRDVGLRVHIKGQTPVIPHRWSEKAKRMMPGHPERESVKTVKSVRNPVEEAEGCLYLLNDRLALPAVAFKAAIVGACRFFDKPSMVECKQLIYVIGEGPEQLVPIEGVKELHEDTPRNANGSADLRYRYYILDWSAQLEVKYIESAISAKSVLALVDAAGRGGVGDWRPSAPQSKTGTYGTWRVDLDKEIEYVEY